MSDEGRARRKEPWDMTGPELIEALATEVFSGATMKTAQAREVQAMITAWQDAAASDHAHAQRQAERAEQAEARVAKLEGALREAVAVAKLQARGASSDMRIAVHPLTCDVDSRHAPLYPWWTGSQLVLACIDCEYMQEVPAALSAPGREGGESQPLPPNPTCPECHGTGDAPNAQFRCPCRWRHLSKAAREGER
jgi:hypothetical protein